MFSEIKIEACPTAIPPRHAIKLTTETILTIGRKGEKSWLQSSSTRKTRVNLPFNKQCGQMLFSDSLSFYAVELQVCCHRNHVPLSFVPPENFEPLLKFVSFFFRSATFYFDWLCCFKHSSPKCVLLSTFTCFGSARSSRFFCSSSILAFK